MFNFIAMILATSAIITGLICLGILLVIVTQAEVDHEVYMEVNENEHSKNK